MSRVLSQAGNLPSAAGFSSMKDDLSFKQGLENSNRLNKLFTLKSVLFKKNS